MRQTRLYKLDNIRFILIFLVVFGHFLELIPGELSASIYRIIYTFHMPAFIFISGYLAKYKRRKIILSFLLPYIIFQYLYQMFVVCVMNPNQVFQFQFSYPYWILWYLFVLMLYYFLIPFFDDERRWFQIMMIGGAIIVSLLTGFDATIEYNFSISRFFTFLPYFLTGYYLGKRKKIFKIGDMKWSWWIRLLVFAYVCFVCFYLWNNPLITPKILYGVKPYHQLNSSPWIKFSLIVIAYCGIIFLMQLPLLGKKIPIITKLGQNTLPVFLLHGFFINLAKKQNIFLFSTEQNILLALQYTAIIIVVFGNPISAFLFKHIFTGKWIDMIYEKRKGRKKEKVVK